jgi:hypothetical protein
VNTVLLSDSEEMETTLAGPGDEPRF